MAAANGVLFNSSLTLLVRLCSSIAAYAGALHDTNRTNKADRH